MNKLIRLNRKELINSYLFFIGTLLVLVVVSFLSYNRISELSTDANLVNHSHRVNLRIKEVVINTLTAETGQRNYLLTGDTAFLDTFRNAAAKIPVNIASLDTLTTDNPVQQANIKELMTLVGPALDSLNNNIKMFVDTAYPVYKLRTAVEHGDGRMEQIRARLNVMKSTEDALLHQRVLAKNHLVVITPFFSLLLSLCALLVVAGAYIRLRREMRLRMKAEDREYNTQKLQELTRESDERFRLIADTAPVLIWLSGPDKLCYFFNKGWLQFTGRTIEQELGNGWREGVHPDDLQQCIDKCRASFDARIVFSMEYRLRRHDGEYRWISDSGVPRYDAKGIFAGYTGGCLDIHDRKNFAGELERQVRQRTDEMKRLNDQLVMQNSLFSHAEEIALIGSYSWNLRTLEMEYSDNLYRLFGVEPNAFKPSFEKFLEFIHPEDREQVIKDGAATRETRELAEHIYRIITAKGEIKYLRSSGNFLDNGIEEFLVGTVQDITRDRQLNETMIRKNRELERSNAELASFSYIASHDLQEPLRKIHIFSERLLDTEAKSLSETGKTYFSRIMMAAKRMQGLIEALLDYSRVGDYEQNFVMTDLNILVKEVLLQLDEMIRGKNAVMELNPLPSLAIIPLQFNQLFQNMISNALKYSRPGVAPHIVIKASLMITENEAQPELGKDKYWRISISDNGIGFEQQFGTKIFELFQRLHKKNYEGTGIGLAICKKIVHNHHGYITAHGEPGNGAVFSIFIPKSKMTAYSGQQNNQHGNTQPR